MAAFTGKASGDWNADGQTTWNEVGHPDGADDTADTGAFAITCATAPVCGAVTVPNGGRLDTGTAAATIASITTSGNGAVTIGTGGCTFNGVLNNAGTGTLTINGACTGITTFTSGTCTLNANVTATGIAIASGKVVTRTAGNLTWEAGGTFVIAGTLNWTTAGGTITLNNTGSITGAGSLNFTGTAVAVCTITSGDANIRSFNVTGTSAWSYVDAIRVVPSGATFTTFFQVHMQGKAGDNAALFYNSNYNLIEQCYLSTGGRGFSGLENIRAIRNLVIGYTRAGAAAGLYDNKDWQGPSTVAATPWTGAVLLNGGASEVGITRKHGPRIDNLGYVPATMCPNPSDLYTAVVTAAVQPGISKRWNYEGTIERSTANPPTVGGYHARLTPNANVTATAVLEFSLYIPIVTGDNISVAAKASRSTTDLTSACADCWIDPEGAWFSGTSAVAWTLTNADTYYALPSCTATNAGGTGAKGMCRVVFRLKEYSASDFLDIGDVVITCGDRAYAVSMQNWSNGMPTIDAPPTDAAVAEAVWEYEDRTTT